MRFHVIPLSDLDLAGFMRLLFEKRRKQPVGSDLWREPLYVHRSSTRCKGLNDIQKRFQNDQDCFVFLTPKNLSLLRDSILKLEPIADISELELPAIHHLSKI